MPGPTGGPIVDAAWRRILERCGPRPTAVLTDDFDLHLVVNGERLDRVERRDQSYTFLLPSPAAGIRVVSLADSPQMLGFARDPRRLGVAVQRITVRQGVGRAWLPPTAVS